MLPEPSPGSSARKCGKQPLPGKPRGVLCFSANAAHRGGDSLPTRTSGSHQGTHGKRYYFLSSCKSLPRRQQNEFEFDKSPGFQGSSKLSFLPFLERCGRKLKQTFPPPLLLSMWDSPNIFQIILQNKYQCVSLINALLQQIYTDCVLWGYGQSKVLGAVGHKNKYGT